MPSRSPSPFGLLPRAGAFRLFTRHIPRPLTANPPAKSATDSSSSGPHAAAIREIEAIIETHYVFPDLRAPIIGRLENARHEGRYEEVAADEFVERINEDLKSVSHDGHLYLKRDPAEYAAALAPAKSDAGLDAYRRSVARREHHGLSKLEVFPGNIRYLKISSFRWIPDGTSTTAYTDATRFLAEGDAIIVDLRGNGGGESDAADTFLDMIVRPNHASPQMGDSRPPKPFYILVDNFVASAAEAVCYSSQLEGTAIIVGATTYGAANNNKRFPIPPQFILSVSYHRPINPISGTNWEGVGITPDIKVDPSLASEAAQLDAISRVAASPAVSADLLANYHWIQARLRARLQPVTLSPDAWHALAGTYGPIELRVSDAALRLYRQDRPHWPQGILLSPMSSDGTFSLEGTDDIRVRLGAAKLELLRPGQNSPESFMRN